jgi:hypothetical protein
MFGGWGNPRCGTTLNDTRLERRRMGTDRVFGGGDPSSSVPSLANHSMAWDATRNAMIVTSGFLTSWHTPNEETWYVTFTNSAGSWLATWTLASGIGCQAAANSLPDPVVHEGAQMAYDPVGQVQVFFGGEAAGGESSYGNTVECR